jgi:hypothetical protein
MTHVGPSGADDAALLAAAAAGDEQAFAAFYRRHVAAVTGFHLRRTGPSLGELFEPHAASAPYFGRRGAMMR